jgi:FG-GAP-like repeat/ASPIC and UnbV
MFAFNAPYYGIWWGGSDAPNSLLPRNPNGTFAANILPDAIVNAKGQPETNLFQNQYGQAIVDVKGAVVRDFDGDGKPDVIAAAYSDVWDGIQQPPLAPALQAGASVDLNHDGIPDGGWQGAWPHGIIALQNISTPGHIRFRDESATATDEGLGFGDRMDAYETIPVDLNHDGKLDLVVIGIRNFTGYDSLQYQTPIIKVYKNVSTPGHLHFVDVTKNSGLNFMHNPQQLSQKTGGLYPITILDDMLGGGPLVLEPNLSAGAAVDHSNDGNPDLVLVDRQFTSRNPLTGQEFAPWVFRNDGNFHFTWIKPAESGLTHTSREISYGDLNGNGREDLVMVNGSGGGQTVDDNNYVWWNQIQNHNHWIEIRVRSASDPMGPLGLGAKVTVYRAGTRQILGDDEMRTDFGYRSRRDAVLHFGLGNASSVDVRVQGEGLGPPVTIHNPKADRAITITVPPQAPTIAKAGAHPQRHLHPHLGSARQQPRVHLHPPTTPQPRHLAHHRLTPEPTEILVHRPQPRKRRHLDLPGNGNLQGRRQPALTTLAIDHSHLTASGNEHPAHTALRVRKADVRSRPSRTGGSWEALGTRSDRRHSQPRSSRRVQFHSVRNERQPDTPARCRALPGVQAPALPHRHALSCLAARGGRLHRPDDAQAERREADVRRRAAASLGHPAAGLPHVSGSSRRPGGRDCR